MVQSLERRRKVNVDFKFQPISIKLILANQNSSQKSKRHMGSAVSVSIPAAPKFEFKAAKKRYVHTLSTVTISEHYNLPLKNIVHLNVSKRQYHVDDCGPEVLGHRKVKHMLKITDPQKIDKILHFGWALWVPTPSWRLKVNQLYDLEFFAHTRKDLPSIGYAYNVKLRLGKRWLGPDIETSKTENTFLHRIDFNDDPSELFIEMDQAWAEFAETIPPEDSTKEERPAQRALVEQHMMSLEDKPEHANRTTIDALVNKTSRHQQEMELMALEDTRICERLDVENIEQEEREKMNLEDKLQYRMTPEKEAQRMVLEDKEFYQEMNRSDLEKKEMAREDKLLRRRSFEIKTMTSEDKLRREKVSDCDLEIQAMMREDKIRAEPKEDSSSETTDSPRLSSRDQEEDRRDTDKVSESKESNELTFNKD